ncbi:MAG: OmpA family protein [Flavobacteriales bacterium]|nr:OmpA family protein [Flavobacteriales bacterium]
MLTSSVQCLQAQDGERELTGEVSTSNYRAPFGDDLEIFNLGTEVNSVFSEYNPVISPDAELMLFTTRNDSVTGEKIYDQDRQHFEDIHIARAVNGRYVADDKVDHPLTTFVSTVNSRKHEAPVYIQEEAETIVLFKDNDLWFSKLEDGVYGEPVRYSKNINFKYYHRHASLTKDGNTMVFTAEVLDKKLNRFHLDIFRTEKDAEGIWSKPVRLPTFINSPYNEDSPEISPDGKLLFFSSDRTDGVGGYDVYYVELFRKDSLLHRLAAPINSPADDIYFKMIEDSSVAFLSSNRLGGYGNMDIYKLIFHKFDTESCDPNELKNTQLVMNGPDTVLVHSKLVMNARGSKVGGIDPRTTHWYLNDSLVGITDRLEIPADKEGQYELRLYASVIDEKRLLFQSSCVSKTIHVLAQDAYAKHSPIVKILEGIASDVSERQFLAALPRPSGELGLKNDVVTTYINAPVIIPVMKNDENEDIGALKLHAVGRPLHGSTVAENLEKGEIRYQPAKDYSGLDAFKYTARSPYGKTGIAWVGVRVLDNSFFSLNKKVKDDVVSTPANQSVKINLFENDTIPEGMHLRISGTTLPVNGSLNGIDLNNGVVIYSPAKDFVGSDMFTYAVNYPDEGEQKAFVRVHVLGPQGAMPLRTQPDFASTMEGELVSLNVFLNDGFNEADAPIITAISKTNNGASQIYDAEEGTVVYAPFKSFHGYEYFTYTATLKDGSKHVEAISIHVEPEELILASVDEPLEKADDGTQKAPTEMYNITELDEDKVNVKDRPDIAFQQIYFDFDRVNVRADARQTMDNNIAMLKEYPKAVIQVVSHCDSRGPKAYNMILSARRAKSTVDYLVQQGIAKDRVIASVGVGEDNLVNDCGDGVPCSNADHQKNRRSELIVVGSLR